MSLRIAPNLVPLAILAGDENERIAAGARLFRQGYTPWLILTDMRLEVSASEGVYSATVGRKAVAQGVSQDRILIAPGQVGNTYEEAARLRDFALSDGFRSLIVVTSPFHTRRARGLLQGALRGSGVTLIVRPPPRITHAGPQPGGGHRRTAGIPS